MRDDIAGLRPEEAAVMAFLQKRLAWQANERPPETKPDNARGLADALARSLGREPARADDQR